MKRIFIIAIIFIFAGTFLAGYRIGEVEATRSDRVERKALSHIALIAKGDIYSLQFICNRKLVAYRAFDDVGRTPLIDESFEPRSEWASVKLFLRYSDWFIAGTTGSLVSRLEWKRVWRVVRNGSTGKKNRLLAIIVAGGTGLYAGYLFGERNRPQCDDKEILDKVHDPKIWDRARSSIIFQVGNELLAMEEHTPPDPDSVIGAIGTPFLGSGLVDYSQKMTVAARAMAEKKTVGQRS